VVRRITGDTIGTWFAREVAAPLGADFHIGLPASEDGRVSLIIPPPVVGLAGADPGDVAVRTFTSPLLDASMATQEWWRRAEIPAANGQGNARSVAAVQSIIAGGGEARGVRLLSTEGCAVVFDEQSNGKDLVLGLPMRYGMGYGLSGELMPMGPRACFWGGYGGSLIVMDQDARLTVSYVMNKMQGGLSGDLRGANIVMAAVMGLVGGSG
jgi:CubicO group peptidase (beta-lactamase class C family)